MHSAAADVVARSYTSQALAAGLSGEGEHATPASAARRPISPTRGTMAEFKLHVYRQQATSDGDHLVLQAEGPHKRSIFWVPHRQTGGMPR